MTLRGTCKCGRLLWFDTVDTIIKRAKNIKIARERHEVLERYVEHIQEYRPNGDLVCGDCGKHYTEEEFRALKDCKCYGEDAPEESYQQAIARGYEHFYGIKNHDEPYKSNIKTESIIFGICASSAWGLLHWFTSIVRNPYDMAMVAIWDFLFIITLFPAVIVGVLLILDIAIVISDRVIYDVKGE
jgi:hypothetical protein